MKKIFTIESIILFLLLLTMMPIIIIVSLKSAHPMYYNYLTILCYLTLAMPIIILLIELYNVAKIKDYKRLNYLNLCMTLILVIGLAIYMIMVNTITEKFYQFKILYFVALPLALVLPICISFILEIKSKKEINKNVNKKIVRNK